MSDLEDIDLMQSETNQAESQLSVNLPPIQKRQKQQYTQKPQDLIGLVTHQIQDEISHSNVQIPDHQTPFQLAKNHSKLKQDTEKADQRKIADIVHRRRDLQNEMTRLKYQQQQEKLKMRSSSMHHLNKTVRSTFDKNDQESINKIKKSSEEFQKKLQLKDKQLQALLQEQKKKQIIERRKMIQKLKEKKHIQVQKSIIKIKESHQQRVKKINDENKQFQKVKKEKTAFQKIEDIQKSLQKLKYDKQKQVLEEKRRQMKLNMQEIKRHQKKYYDMIKVQRAQMEKNLEKQKEQSKKQRQYMTHYRKSKFLQKLIDEEHQKAQQQKLKIRKLQHVTEKKTSFGQNLRKQHKQQLKKLREKSKQKQDKQRQMQLRKLKAKSLSSIDIYRIGQRNMVQAHQSVTADAIHQSKVELQQNYKSLRDHSNRIRYQDYLQDSKLKKQQMYRSRGHSMGNPEQRQPKQLRQLKSVMLKEADQKDKLYRARLIAEKLDEKAKNSNTNMMINSIAAKLKIIEEFV